MPSTYILTHPHSVQPQSDSSQSWHVCACMALPLSPSMPACPCFAWTTQPPNPVDNSSGDIARRCVYVCSGGGSEYMAAYCLCSSSRPPVVAGGTLSAHEVARSRGVVCVQPPMLSNETSAFIGALTSLTDALFVKETFASLRTCVCKCVVSVVCSEPLLNKPSMTS